MTAMRVKRVRRIGQVLAALAVGEAQGDCVTSVPRVQLVGHAALAQAAPQVQAAVRGWRSSLERLARGCLGVVAAMRAAVAFSRTAVRHDASALAPQARHSRDPLDVSGGQLS